MFAIVTPITTDDSLHLPLRRLRCRRSARVLINQIILFAVFVFLGDQSEELDQTKAQWRRP
jgi:hypothetical protein